MVPAAVLALVEAAAGQLVLLLVLGQVQASASVQVGLLAAEQVSVLALELVLE